MKAPFFICLLLFFHFTNTTWAQLGSRERKYDIVTGTLTDEQFSQLKQFLYLSTKKPLRDTIFIKYDFNKADCWYYHDMFHSDSSLKLHAEINKIYYELQEVRRPQLTTFRFREPGNKCNRITELNPYIHIDDQKYLKKLFFKQRPDCGTTALIMPDGRFLLVINDSRLEVLYFNTETLNNFFDGKNSSHSYYTKAQ
jgi:hypothetical protein